MLADRLVHSSAVAAAIAAPDCLHLKSSWYQRLNELAAEGGRHPAMAVTMDLRGGPVALDQETVFRRFAEFFPLRGSRVVEIGGRLDAAALAAVGVTTWLAVDPRNEPGLDGPVHSIRGSATSIPTADASIDFVFSCNALQHIHPLAEVLAEAHRILKPGGVAYFNFGPVWSAPDGAHVEGLVFEGRRYDFWNGSLMPAWAHLVLDGQELASLLTPYHGPGLARSLSDWVFSSDWINRKPLHEILHILNASPLVIVSIKGCAEFGYDFRSPQISHALAQRLGYEEVVRQAWERHRIPREHLDIRDVEVVLVAKRGTAG